MSNRRLSWNDAREIDGSRGSKWIRILGVDFVMRRRNCKAGLAGLACVALAVLAGAISIASGPGARGLTIIVASGQMAIIGVMLMCYQGLLRRTSSSQELYRVGYDIGFEDGYAEGQQEPVVVDITGRRKAMVNHGRG